VLPSGAGVLNCASATHRTIDKAVWLASGQPLQCIQGTEPYGPGSRIPGAGPYSNVFGQFYGLVFDQIPGIFFSGTFTAEQYQLVAQIMDFKRWFIGNVSYEILDRAPDYYMDQYIISWVTAQLAQEATTPVPSAFPVSNSAPTLNWDFEGTTGSPFAVPASELVSVNRYGQAVGMNIQLATRLFTVIAPVDIDGMQLVAAEGICATVLGLIPANTPMWVPRLARLTRPATCRASARRRRWPRRSTRRTPTTRRSAPPRRPRSRACPPSCCTTTPTRRSTRR
jgi:hypothetical protein